MVDRSAGWRLATAATLLSAFVSLGFSVASLADPALIVPGLAAASVMPLTAYAVVRSAVVAVAAVIVVSRRDVGPLLTVGWIAGGIQALDVVPGLLQHDIGKSVGPAVLAAFSAYALTRQAGKNRIDGPDDHRKV